MTPKDHLEIIWKATKEILFLLTLGWLLGHLIGMYV